MADAPVHGQVSLMGEWWSWEIAAAMAARLGQVAPAAHRVRLHSIFSITSCTGVSVSGYEPCAKIVGCLLASVLFARRTTGIESNRFRAMQVELAAHAVVVSLSYFSWVLPFGISMACNIRVGNQGSRELRQ